MEPCRAGYSPWGCKELDMTECACVHGHTHTHTVIYQITSNLMVLKYVLVVISKILLGMN